MTFADASMSAQEMPTSEHQQTPTQNSHADDLLKFQQLLQRQLNLQHIQLQMNHFGM